MKYWAVSAFSYIGLSTVMWAIGRVFHYLTLLRKDEMYAKERPYKSDKRYKTLRILSLVFYVLGNVVSLAIQGIDHLCHKRLYHVHLIAMKDLKKVTQEYCNELETCDDISSLKFEYDDFCAGYHVGPQDHYDPMDLPDWWDSLD